MPKKKQSDSRRELVSARILEEAAALFAERGFSSTNLQDVADALSVSRTALYHYIGSKEELLPALVKDITAETAAGLRKLAADPSLPPLEKLTRAITEMATRIATSPARFRLLLASEGMLPEPLASEHHKARRATLKHLSAIIAEGTQSGVLRPVDEQLAAFSVLGTCNWVAWWYQPDHARARGPASLAAALADIVVGGLRSPDARGEYEGQPVERALAALREDMAYLERAIGSRTD
jgi:AcrR family transcriptional regulator